MLSQEPDPKAAAASAAEKLGSHDLTLAHERHLHRDEVRDFGLKVVDLEDDQKFQDLVLAVHHACTQTLGATSAYKLIENHSGSSYILSAFHT